ncbi:hypothetical protein EVJ58_g6692 [Rhodofomes roseus]|uniref:Uncharacterized protein n=1 Tax=Rhodofomes roseus TaxID=34475 RepID=A0A4Y9Y664_9APHY|nr:hypothetical protein EVJ58_g6692 [Rhodofomes roseus]
MILTPKDATGAFSIGEDDEDVLNQINLSYDGNYLAFSTDNGAAGVVELSTGQVSRMNTRHTSICGSINFIPDRPSELVSGGYDCKLLHHDFQQRTLLSDLDVAQSSASGASDEPGLQLSPPFVLSTAITSTGMFAAGTANGMLFIGTGGEKCPDGHVKKKRRRKWEGLVDTEGTWTKVAEGPVVAMCVY